MTLDELKEAWHDEIHNWDVKNLRAEDEFMAYSFHYQEFAAYALLVRPELSNDKQPKIHFLGLGHSKVPDEPETPQIAAEPVEELSNTQQIMTDLKAYKKKQGFI